jgi:hypothetical protein
VVAGANLSTVALVHLVWAPLGAEPLQDFLAQLESHPPGVEHRLVVVLKGFPDDAALAGPRALLVGVDHSELVVSRREYDLGTYRGVASACTEPVLAFLNSAARPLVSGWLAAMCDALREPQAGMVAATGSFESILGTAPGTLKPLRALHFPGFPNPHLRTNAFALRRGVLEQLRWGDPRTKGSSRRLESGRRSLTRQVQGLGLRPLVVGRDGRGYEVAEWPNSGTFRSGEQENLLVADNRTDQYAQADAAERLWLATMAWGANARSLTE